MTLGPLGRLVPLETRRAGRAWVDAARDYWLRPETRDPLGGGPLNGQRDRQALVLALCRAIDCDLVIETGTFRGSTTEFLAGETGLPVRSVEAHPVFHRYARLRLRRACNVRLDEGDSRAFLRGLAADAALRGSRALVYLDAHGGDDLPLREEVEIVAGAWERSVTVIDDFEVPGDPGYAFDDDGPGKRFSLEYLEPLGLRPFFPSTPSSQETGARRGCVVLATRTTSAAVDRVAACGPPGEG